MSSWCRRRRVRRRSRNWPSLRSTGRWPWPSSTCSCLPALRRFVGRAAARFSWPSSSAWSATYSVASACSKGLVVFTLSPFHCRAATCSGARCLSGRLPRCAAYRAPWGGHRRSAPPAYPCLIRLAASIGRITERLTPQMLATFVCRRCHVAVFGATPGEAERLHWLDRVLPLGVIEASHVTAWRRRGPALLLLSQGLSRRLDAAY